MAEITDLNDCIICCSAVIGGLVFYHYMVVDHRIVTAVHRYVSEKNAVCYVMKRDILGNGDVG